MTARIRKAWRVTVKGYEHSGLVYAPTAGKARSEMYGYDAIQGVRIVDITARRASERDITLPARDPIADLLTAKETHCLSHANGTSYGDVNKAGYRDYFYTRYDDPPLVGLVGHGLMENMWGCEHGPPMANTYFVLTALGKQVAASLVPEYNR